MQTVIQDLRYAVRQLWKSPGFTAAAVLTLAIGIGCNTAIFSMMDAIVLRPLAVPDMDRVVVVAEAQDGTEHSVTGESDYKWVTLANFEDWKHQSRSFEDLAVYYQALMSLTGAGDAAHVPAVYTTASLFRVLEAKPLLGRVFVDSESQVGRDTVAVLSFGFWQKQFAADPGILGRKIELNQRSYTVIGVMPKSLEYPSTADLYLPFAPTPAQLQNRSGHDYLVVGLLNKGVTTKAVQAEMHVIAERLSKAYPATNTGWSVKVVPLLDRINGTLTPLYMKLIMGATIFVLLVVCANVANLQFARGIARRPEIAMRTALGASRWRLIRQLLTESILLGLIGAAGGVLVAKLNMHLSLITMPAQVARYMAGWANISLSGRALLFSLLLAIGAGVIAGFVPALEALRMNVVDQLKSGSRSVAGGRSHKLRNIFAVAQISLAVALVIGAALICKGMWSMVHFADAYGPKQTMTFRVTLPLQKYDTPQKQAAFYQASLEKLRALPGVKHAVVATALPYSDAGWMDDCEIENRPLIPGKFRNALRLDVSQGYFNAVHIPMVTGRDFSQGDALDTQPVAIVSRTFVSRYFPGENPIGHKIRLGAGRASHEPWMTIVGIAEDTRYSWWDQAFPATVYMNAAQIPPQDTFYALMTEGDPLALAPAARKAMAGLDSTLPLDDVQTYDQILHLSLIGLIYVAAYLGVDALIALLLAAIGIFAVMANLVAERTREIGVRLAMGARREDVQGMILKRAAWLTGTGVVAGLVMAFGLARMTANLLAGVRPDDPVVFTGITAAIAGIAIWASWIPARRASRIDPMQALRDE